MEIIYKYLNKEDEVQSLYKLQSIPAIYEWIGMPMFPPVIRDRAKNKNIFIAKDGDKVVGWIDFNLCKDGFFTIHTRGVHPDYQGRGIASVLTDKVPPRTEPSAS